MRDKEQEYEDHLEKLFNFIEKKVSRVACSSCGKFTKRILMNTKDNQPIIFSDEGGKVKIYSFYCNNCFNITSFLKQFIDEEIRKEEIRKERKEGKEDE